MGLIRGGNNLVTGCLMSSIELFRLFTSIGCLNRVCRCRVRDLSRSSVLQSVMQPFVYLILMQPPLSASFITVSAGRIVL